MTNGSESTHVWPRDGEHLFGPWLVLDRKHHRRVCVHPHCTVTETKEAPKS